MTIYDDITLTTLDAVLAQKGMSEIVDPADDRLLWSFIVAATAMVHQFCHRAFVPYRQTRVFDAAGDFVDDEVLELDEDLLEALTVTNGDGTALASDDYVLLERNTTPYTAIALQASASQRWTYTTNWRGAIQVEGFWGYHESYGQAWVDSGDSVQDEGGITAAATSLAVTDVTGKDGRYRTRFQTGTLLRLDDETLQVVAVDAETDTLTVRRGLLGTTAAAHAIDTAIHTYAPMRNIEQAVISLALWLYRNRATAGDEIQFMDGRHIIQNKAPSNIRQVLDRYVRWPRGF